MNQKFLAIRSLLLVILVLSVRSPIDAQEKKNLRVVFTGLAWNSELPFRVALARGFFKAQGLEVQPIFVRGGPAALAALFSGEVDFAEIGGAQAGMSSRPPGLWRALNGAIPHRSTTQLLPAQRTRGPAERKRAT